MANRRERRRQQREGDETLVDLVEARESAQGFLEKNQKMILGVATVIVLAIAGYVLWKALVRDPKVERAQSEIYKAEAQFARDSFASALSNPGGGYPGFLDIIDDYGSTPTGNTARYYAAVCYLNLGDYEKTIDLLNDVKPTGEILSSTKFGLLGDAHSEQGDFDAATKFYRKAVTNGDNSALQAYYLKKLGMLFEKQGENDRALKTYKEIREKHYDTPQGRDIDKYIAKLEV